jgi:methionyl-tRNA formyltransferase
VQAFAPRPGAYAEHRGERIKILGAVAVDGTGAPGTVLDEQPTVACGAGALRLTRVQRAGRDALDAEAFRRGFVLPAGSNFNA